MYVEYLKDFWYTAEVDDATKDISFSLSFFENQLSFNRLYFLTAIGLNDSKSVVPLPPKGTVRAGLATLGLADKDKPSLTSTELVNSSPLKLKYFSPIWKIFMQYIVKCLGGMQGSHDQMNFSQQTIAYCLIFVAKLLKKPDESLILPSEEVNAEATADKSQSGTNVQPLSQPKALTATKSKKKKIPSSTQPKSLEASVTAEVQVNQLKAADTTKTQRYLRKLLRKRRSLRNKLWRFPPSWMKLTKQPKKLHRAPMTPTVDSDDTNDNKVSHSAYTSQGIASAERLSIPYHLDHICEEVSYLHSRLRTMKSFIVQIVSDEIKSSLPAMITNALQEQLPGILSAVSKQFAETEAQLNKKVVKQLNRQFNISHIAQSNRFVTLQKELSKVIKSEVAKKVQVVGLEGVREDLQSQTKHISKYSSSFQDMQTQLQDVKDLLESAIIIDETVEGEKKQKDINAIPAPTQGEHKTAENITLLEPSSEIQGELDYKESTIPVFERKVNEESAMVLYNPEKDLVDLTTTEQDSEDDDDLDKQPLSKRFKIMHPITSKPQPSRDSSKGKAVAFIEEPRNELVQYQEEGGSNPKAPKLKPFTTLEGPLSQEEFDKQIKELKRISELKAKKERSE
ncbi:hypothetical protein Tco_1094995 [Tanacetum coccineum]